MAKSAAHDYCRNIPTPDDSPEQGETVPTEENSDAIPPDKAETPKSFAELLLELQDAVLDAYRVSEELGDKDGMEMARRKLAMIKRQGDEYFRRQMIRVRQGLPVEE
jgi:hypothetical protein